MVRIYVRSERISTWFESHTPTADLAILRDTLCVLYIEDHREDGWITVGIL
jgi:hypothetical protein